VAFLFYGCDPGGIQNCKINILDTPVTPISSGSIQPCVADGIIPPIGGRREVS
jgi:hypothetical protein